MISLVTSIVNNVQPKFVAAGLASAVLASAAFGCASNRQNGAGSAPPVARAQLVDATGVNVGTATFAEGGGGVQVAVRVHGLQPGMHGIHLHETGACQPPDFKSAGGHLNPDGKKHGLQNRDGAHAGDMPNLTVRADGSADTTLIAPDATTDESAASVLSASGRAIVIHASADDQKTDPSGNSGARIACGVVRPL